MENTISLLEFYLYLFYVIGISFSLTKVFILYRRRLLIKAIFWMTVCIFLLLLLLLLPIIGEVV